MTATATKERPILFSAPMVRALLAGTKTQTRRTIGEHRVLGDPLRGSRWTSGPNGFRSENSQGILGVPYISIRRDHGVAVRYYGAPGDRLWVRETHAADARDGVRYHATDLPWFAGARWTPSIHMPRRLCRIVLELTDVRVERLQAITEDDAVAEGVERIPGGWACPLLDSGIGMVVAEARTAYHGLWNSINGAGAWDANPWVWALTFRRVTP